MTTTTTRPSHLLSLSFFLLISLSSTNVQAHDGSDPFFYSQSYTFEYQHQQHAPTNHYHPPTTDGRNRSSSSFDNNTASSRSWKNRNKKEANHHDDDSSTTTTTAQTFHIVYENEQEGDEDDAQRQQESSYTANTWLSRAEHEVHAYAFESTLQQPFFLTEEELEKKREEEESDDDEDDDDNDGSCSMLSNASLQRNNQVAKEQEDQVVATPPSSSSHKDRTKLRGGAQSHAAAPRGGWIQRASLATRQRSNEVSPVVTQLLRLRGGTVTSANDLGSEVLKRLYVSALVTVIFEGCMGHIFEFLKIVMQTSPTKTTYSAVIKEITAEKGIGGLWDGFVPWGVVQAVSKGAVFGMAHTTATKLFMPLAEKGTIPPTVALTLAGGIGGGVQGLVLSPLLLLKTRVMTSPVFRQKLSLWETTCLSASVGLDIVRTEGLGTLMKGAKIFATKRVFDWSTRYFFAEMIEEIIGHWKGGQPLSLAEKSAASFLGGVFSTCFTLPLDVLVAKTQDAKKAGVKVSGMSLFKDELKEKGWSGLSEAYLRGFSVRLLHVCLTVVVMKTIAPLVYDALFG